jgi:hypothetical protein
VRHRTHRTLVLGGVLVLSLGLGACGGSDSPPTPLTPSPIPPQVTVPALRPPGTLSGVSLSGVVYELTPTGRSPIPKAYVYCEACSEQTHMFVLANEGGFYQFSGDVASGGGVWLTHGVPTDINVGATYNPDYEDPPGLTPARGRGWREVLIDGDTRFDIELVRRGAATP